MGKQTKVLLVSGDEDYNVLDFEEYNEQNGLTLRDWCYVLKDTDGNIEYIDEDGLSFTVELFEFDEVDRSFISFIRDRISDSDTIKHTEFLVVEDYFI